MIKSKFTGVASAGHVVSETDQTVSVLNRGGRKVTLNRLLLNISNHTYHFGKDNEHYTFYELNAKHNTNYEIIECHPARFVIKSK